ncbi:thiamine ABC transporter substrate binding subunit [Kibdelosporangium persicum]|uniref:Periplasmic substrate-binding component of ABC-type thiamine transport system n=1 Tax=Kibdelosporangium persicum TaxID=2698649 RepID=A0ABX2F8W0_9PSEU|nr:thiamine ABC transporter substrate-binding protein [Kibdelosporangium persicum]NRN67752.1 Periplasmic substrate-binding component of ABC-type thiamine transport system [Kibdelosporangium persicum]
MLKAVVVAATVLVTASCSLATEQPRPGNAQTVTLVTHDSFAVRKELLDEFQKNSGITVEVRKSGDAGALTNQLVLTKANPIGDIAFGVDSTFASRALNENVFQPYQSPDANKRYQLDDTNRLTAVDIGDVCVNVHTTGLKGVPEPTTFEDLADPKYKDMLVVESPATSSPGLAFLLGTILHFGADGWQDYWTRLKANGVKVVSGWEEAYNQEFSGTGKGTRPLVVSYASSPAATPDTKALLETCYRQIEYAGVLQGAKNPEGARKVLDFLISQQFQAEVPDQMYVYPVREGVALPEAWQKAAPMPTDTEATLPAQEVDRNRENWVNQWRSLVQG